MRDGGNTERQMTSLRIRSGQSPIIFSRNSAPTLYSTWKCRPGVDIHYYSKIFSSVRFSYSINLHYTVNTALVMDRNSEPVQALFKNGTVVVIYVWEVPAIYTRLGQLQVSNSTFCLTLIHKRNQLYKKE